MTFASQYHMPGAYFDSQAPAVHPGVFRPPTSPSAASSMYLAKSTGSLQSESTTPASNVKRKRTRNEASREGTPLHDWYDANLHMDGAGDGSRVVTPAANLGRGEMRYTLAGQINTPGGANPHVENGILEESMYSDVDYRRALGSKRPHNELESPVAGQPTLLVNPEQQPTEGWSRFAFGTIGGVVGKVWEFCRTGAFGGFYAGGGKGYTLEGQESPAADRQAPTGSGQTWCNEHDVPTLNASAVDHSIPGGFPSPDYTPYSHDYGYQEKIAPEPTPSRPAVKRRQLTCENDELRHWVMVDEMSAAGTRSASSASKTTPRSASRNARPSLATGRRISIPVSRLNSTPGLPRRHSNRISHAGPPSVTTHQPASTASFAGSRSPRPSSPAPDSPSRIPIPSQPAGHGLNPFARHTVAGTRRSAIPSPIQATFGPNTHRRTHSGASAASPRGKPKEFDVEDIEASPRLDPEAKKLAARRVLEERDTDARISAFNARLKDMIRQGKEALGTKVEVEGGESGWMDDD